MHRGRHDGRSRVRRQPGYNFKATVFENGSTDDVFDKLVALIRRDPRCKVVHFARNFRADGGVAADVSHAEGAAAVIMCADLRDT